MVKQDQIITALFFFFLFGANSVFGSSSNPLSNKTEILLPESILAGSIEDSLIGTWEIANVDLPELRAQIASASSQAQRDSLLAKIETEQNRLAGMTITLIPDFSYEATMQGRPQKGGIWSVTTSHDLVLHITNHEGGIINETMSIISVGPKTLVLKTKVGTNTMHATYTRRK